MAHDDQSEDDWTVLLRPVTSGGEFEPNPWAWLGEDADAAPLVDIAGHVVTAVLVTFEAARWLPETLAGLAALEHRPHRLIAIDNDSSDESARLLRRALQAGIVDAVYPGRREWGFGTAVASALAQDAEAAPAHRAEAGTSWLWLLHDDAVPAPDALTRLLAQVSAEPGIDVTGPKLLLPRRGRAGPPIAEIGVSISSTGRRELLVDPGEIDQGQRDIPQERLGVSTCGMLVRRSVWDALHGLDPGLPVFRDGVEFGWRAHLAGHRVVTCPQAEFTHREVGRAGLRPAGLTGSHPERLDRRLGLLVVAGHARRATWPFVWLRLVVSCLLRSVGYLLGKVPRRSVDELAALAWFVSHPSRLRAFRRRVRRTPRAAGGAEVVRSLRPPWWASLRLAGEAITGTVSERYRSVAGELEAATLDELTGDEFSSVAEEKPVSPWLRPAVVITVLSVIASLIAARGLFGTGSLTGPALLPAPALGELWRSAWSPIPGAPEQLSPPWIAWSALGSTILAGRPEWFVTVLVCLVVPLSFVAAYPVVRNTVEDRRLRVWAALSYALLPVLLGGTNQGRIALSVVAIGLPLLALAVRALAVRRVRAPEAWRGGWAAGAIVTLLVSFEPGLLIVALLAAAAGAVALRRSPRKIGRIGIALAVPLVVLAPWWPSLVRAPGRLLVGPDSALGGAGPAPEVWALLVGRDQGPGLPPLWLGITVFTTFWLVALLALVRRTLHRVVLAGWTVGLLALGLALVCSRLVVAVPPVGTEVRPAVGAYLLVVFGALLLAGAAGLDGLAAQVRERSFSWLQPATVLAGLVVAAITLTGAGWWVMAGASGPIDRRPLEAIPPYVRNAMTSDARVRVLAIDLQGSSARYSVLADDGQRMGDADRGFAFGGSTLADEQARDLVLRVVAGTADSDITPQLRELGIGYLWVRGATEEDRARIDNTPGLGAASGNETATVWQVGEGTSRAVLVAGDGTAVPIGVPPTLIPAGDGVRQLRIGEAADPRWRAELDGAALPGAPSGWQQAFTVPPASGRLSFSLPSPAPWLLIGQAAALLVATVLAAPAIRRPEVRDPTRSARRASRVIGGRG